jgi:orotidine-5'-phosphate decarboxylase
MTEAKRRPQVFTDPIENSATCDRRAHEHGTPEMRVPLQTAPHRFDLSSVACEAAGVQPGNRLIIALDVASRAQVDDLLARLDGIPCWFKVGLELFTSVGPAIVEHLVGRGHRVMLDLKLHDIPQTVARATAAVAQLGAELCTVHAAGGRAMLEAAVAAAGAMKILAVTVLTSLDDQDLADIGAIGPVAALVVQRAALAIHSGCGGVVASPNEVAALRAAIPATSWLVTPGIRPLGTAAGDQKRIMTPHDARRAGADLIVVGRPICEAADPAAMATAIIEQLATAAPVASPGAS